ncbi:methyl-accepting chemotaxis protein [Thalassospira sp. MA62]|nr:methyl-accepting chemotaxis protein [Thalassospira sp. MA62]
MSDTSQSRIQEKLQPWPQEQQQEGQRVYERVLKKDGLRTALNDAYRSLVPDFTELPDDLYQTEFTKFQNISIGTLTPDYFATQYKIIEGLSATTELTDYLEKGYANYSAGLVNVFLDNAPRFDKDRRALVKSLMRSIFTDVAVVVDSYFQIVTERAEREKRETLDKLTTDFEERIGVSTRHLAEEALKSRNAAISMQDRAQSASGEINNAVTTVEESTSIMQTCASAAEELDASVSDVNQKMDASVKVSQHAAQQAQETEVTVRTLSEAADRIGEVVSLITNIASQTNLLALNATIEAARAGDAGKGFAVVANEVKNLAGQTAKATDEIGLQINQIQQATQDAVTAIERIVATLEEVNSYSGDIFSAISEQGSATREITANIQSANNKSDNMRTHVNSAGVLGEEMYSESTRMAEDMNALAQQSNNMEQVVAQFIADLKKNQT